MDFLTAQQRAQKYFGSEYWSSRGFGLGVFITDSIDQRGFPLSKGQYGWSGAFGNYWFNDPSEEMTALLIISVNWPMVEPPILKAFETMVYQMIDD